MPGFSDPMHARGMDTPLGKYTEEVKTHLDEVTLKAWLRLCHERDKTSSLLLREVIYLICHGKTPGEMSSEDTRALLQRHGSNGALDRFRGSSAS